MFLSHPFIAKVRRPNRRPARRPEPVLNQVGPGQAEVDFFDQKVVDFFDPKMVDFFDPKVVDFFDQKWLIFSTKSG